MSSTSLCVIVRFRTSKKTIWKYERQRPRHAAVSSGVILSASRGAIILSKSLATSSTSCSQWVSPTQVRHILRWGREQSDRWCSDATIRQAVLANLHEQFDKHLAQAENVRFLFIALNDEVFENRETAVGLIGRLALHNPAYVMPSIRKSLIQLLTELEYSTVT